MKIFAFVFSVLLSFCPITGLPGDPSEVISYYCNGKDIYILYGNRYYTAPFTGDEDSVTIGYLLYIIEASERYRATLGPDPADDFEDTSEDSDVD